MYLKFIDFRFGRRKIMFGSLLLHLVSGLATGWSPSFAIFCVVRFLVGVSVSGIFLTAFVLGWYFVILHWKILTFIFIDTLVLNKRLKIIFLQKQYLLEMYTPEQMLRITEVCMLIYHPRSDSFCGYRYINLSIIVIFIITCFIVIFTEVLQKEFNVFFRCYCFIIVKVCFLGNWCARYIKRPCFTQMQYMLSQLEDSRF